jgi:hypothetical protein
MVWTRPQILPAFNAARLAAWLVIAGAMMMSRPAYAQHSTNQFFVTSDASKSLLDSADADPRHLQIDNALSGWFNVSKKSDRLTSLVFAEEESTVAWHLPDSLMTPAADRPSRDFTMLGAGQRSFLSPAMADPEPMGSGNDRYQLNLSGQGCSAEPPPGTMFILRFGAAPPVDGQRPRAGLVLSRPPGAYSQDWIGVAISATVH